MTSPCATDNTQPSSRACAQLLLYLSVGPEEKIKYDYAGELGVNRFEAGVAGYEARGFRGLGVFTSIPYEASAEDNEALQLLQRNTQVGEFYMMAPPVSVSPRTPLPGNYMDIQIYNEEKDAFDVITFADALMYSGFGRAGCPANLFGDYSDGGPAAVAMKKFYPSTGDGPASEWPNAMTNAGGDKTLSFADAWKEVQKLMTTDRQTEASRTKLVDLVTSGKYVPIKLMIARPFIEHHSLSAVMTKAGADTGRTLFGLADMQIAANVQVKTIEGCARRTLLCLHTHAHSALASRTHTHPLLPSLSLTTTRNNSITVLCPGTTPATRRR